jgi:MOSC domain-containing protein
VAAHAGGGADVVGRQAVSDASIRVAGLFIYPLKSAAGIALDAMPLDDIGPRFDRRWMVIDARGRFMSQREVPRLALIQTSVAGPSPADAVLVLTTPGRAPLAVSSPDPGAERMSATVWDDTVDVIRIGDVVDAWLADVLEVPCRLVYFPDESIRIADRAFNPLDRPIGLADGFPLLVVGQESLDDLNGRLRERGHAPLPMNRFRPNIVVRGAAPFAEDGWRELVVGPETAAIGLSIVKPCARCSITTVDQATGVRGKEPLATLATYRRGPDGSVLFAQNAIHDRTGVLRVGDSVRVLE